MTKTNPITRIVTTAAALCLAGAIAGAADMAPERIFSASGFWWERPDVAYNSWEDEYLAVWSENDSAGATIMGRRYDRDGNPVSSTFNISPADGVDRFLPSVAFDAIGHRFFVVYDYDFNGDGSDLDVHGRFLDWNGPNPGYHEIWLAASNDSEEAPEVAITLVLSPIYLVTWTREGAQASIEGTLGSFGNPPVSSFVIAGSPTVSYQRSSIAYQWLNDSFMVVYDDQKDILGRMVPADGSAMGPEISIAGWPNNETTPSVATCQAGSFLVGWQSEQGPGNTDIYARILKVDGNPDTSIPPIQVTNSAVNELEPEIGCIHYENRVDKEYLLAFTGEDTSGSGLGLSASRILPDGRIRTSFGIAFSQPGEFNLYGRVAGGTTGWMVSWGHRPATGATEYHGRVVFDLFSDGFETGTLTQWDAVVQ